MSLTVMISGSFSMFKEIAWLPHQNNYH